MHTYKGFPCFEVQKYLCIQCINPRDWTDICRRLQKVILCDAHMAVFAAQVHLFINTREP